MLLKISNSVQTNVNGSATTIMKTVTYTDLRKVVAISAYSTSWPGSISMYGISNYLDNKVTFRVYVDTGGSTKYFLSRAIGY